MKHLVAVSGLCLLLSSCAHYSDVQAYSFAKISSLAEGGVVFCKDKKVTPDFARELWVESNSGLLQAQNMPGFWNAPIIDGTTKLNDMVKEFKTKIDSNDYSEIYCKSKLTIIGSNAKQLVIAEGKKNR